ncbi:MAG: TIGR04282 family arsenosugar biosynthesis glycosyltransferase [Ignavibacteriaceae bacterium]
MRYKYSIIIPTLNEFYFLNKNLEHIKSLGFDAEIIVSDGGSTDGTIEICNRNNLKLVKSISGRGAQLNAGASVATGDILIFLHADTFLPKNTVKLLKDFFSDNKKIICRFKLGFDYNHKFLDLYTKYSTYDTQFTRFGDSAIIIRKSFFEELNGFDSRETFEDVDFFNRASRSTKIFVLDSIVNSSARRFIKDGIIKRQLFNILLFIGYIFNAKEKTLSKMYNNNIGKIRTDSIIIFLRYPKIGEVKTRLANTTSSEFAMRFYKSCAENIVKNVKKIPGINRFAFYSNEDEKEKIIGWLGNKLFFSPQQGKDLGNRMKNAFEKVFSTGAQKVIIIGTDIPDLSQEVIVKAFNLLDSNDVVIGPSKDGGYYLLGMKKIYPELFEEIEFSLPSVYAETIKKMDMLNLNYYKLPELQDIDTEEDLVHWLNSSSVNTIKHEIKMAYETN